MARGGLRAGAGCFSGAKTASKPVKSAVRTLQALTGAAERRADTLPALSVKHKTALEFAMAVINDPTADMADKVRLAVAAMPFQHGKIAEVAPGKKVNAEQAAREAAAGGAVWGDDLAFAGATTN